MTANLNVIGIVVADLGKSLDFYRRLGLDVPADPDASHVEVPLAGGMKLALDPISTIRSFDPDWTEPSGSPRVSLAFQCADPAEVDRVYADLVGAGYTSHKEPWDAFWGQHYAQLHDPDGNGVDLYAPLPEGA